MIGLTRSEPMAFLPLLILLLCPGLFHFPGRPQTGLFLVEAINQTEQYNLMDYLFTGYRPEVRPSTAGEATFVYIDMYLLSLQDLDEKSQVLESAIILDTYWVDDWLSWDPNQYGGLSNFLYPQRFIWRPDIVIENSVESQVELGYPENKIRVDNSGLIHWKPSQVIRTGCDIDVTYYPFDTQTCNIIVSTWMSTIDDIDIDPRAATEGLVLDKYSSSGTWELQSNTLELLPNDSHGLTRIQFKLTLKRLRTYYVLNIILPVLFLSFTASLVFFLPADAGEKIGMGITVLLAYAVYLTIIADNMPQTSLQVSYLAVYLTLLLGLTALGVVLAVVVLHIHHKPDDCNIGNRTERITRKLRRVLCLYREKPALNLEGPPGAEQKYTATSRPRSRAAVTPVTDEDRSPPPAYNKVTEEEITWPKVAETVDRVLFLLTSFLITVITIVFISILALGAP